MRNIFSRISEPWRLRRLKRKYIKMSMQTPQEAERSLHRQIERLKTSRPGYSAEWYLQKLIYDLEKDRR